MQMSFLFTLTYGDKIVTRILTKKQLMAEFRGAGGDRVDWSGNLVKSYETMALEDYCDGLWNEMEIEMLSMAQ